MFAAPRLGRWAGVSISVRVFPDRYRFANYLAHIFLIIWHLFVEDLSAISQASCEITLASTILEGTRPLRNVVSEDQFPVETHLSKRENR
jgi:hypothetical protein